MKVRREVGKSRDVHVDLQLSSVKMSAPPIGGIPFIPKLAIPHLDSGEELHFYNGCPSSLLSGVGALSSIATK